MKRALAAIASLLFLTGCPPRPLKTITLEPSQLNWSSRYWYKQNAWCSVPLPGQGIPTEGLGPEPVGPGEVIVGFEDVYFRGADPFPCEEEQETLYRGQVGFDLSRFDSITSATLNFDIAQSLSENGGVTNQIPPVCYATTLGMSTGANSDYYYYDFDNPVSLPSSCGPLIRPSVSIGVTSQVRSWVDKSHANFGFILAGPRLDFGGDVPKDNDGNVSWYNDFQLVILYNPTQNPRAPQ